MYLLSVPDPSPAERAPSLSPARRRAFFAATLLLPFLALALVEVVLRFTWKNGDLSLFAPATIGRTNLVTANSGVARRYFAAEQHPPTPPNDYFARTKPKNGFRVFVLGESTAAGFPYPHNGTFSRVLREALHDVLPDDSVEVVNLGIAATNSFTIADITDEVVAQHPDAVLIYAGHNEYYGALGTGSSIRFGSRSLTRALLAAERFRTALVMRNVIGAVTGAGHGSPPHDTSTASFMETVARDQEIALDGDAFRAGMAQFHDNLRRTLQTFRAAGVPVFLASIASNERQPPFASRANGAARVEFDAAQSALAAGDSASARRAFRRARDLDVVRFRAPSALDDTIRALASANGAFYVPVSEAFEASSPARIPGPELFLEHVHPNRTGYALIARAFYDAIAQHAFLGRRAQPSRLSAWSVYEEHMSLSPFDERIVQHIVRTVTTRWPFVSADSAIDYRGRYRPTSMSDSMALVVSRGGVTWLEGKLRVASAYERAGKADSAVAEYRGLLRDLPFAEPSYRLLGRALVAAGRPAEALPYLEHAAAMSEHWESTYLLGVIALQARNYERAIGLLDRAVSLQPAAVAPLYQLSLAFGLSNNRAAARAAAARATQIDPGYPGLSQWLETLRKEPNDSTPHH